MFRLLSNEECLYAGTDRLSSSVNQRVARGPLPSVIAGRLCRTASKPNTDMRGLFSKLLWKWLSVRLLVLVLIRESVCIAAVPELPNDQPQQPSKQSHADDHTEQTEAASGKDRR